MRQVSIPKNFVEALNSMYDEHPQAITDLVAVVSTSYQKEGEAPAPGIRMLDIINAALDAVAPGKRVATIYGADGFEGFVLARDRKVATPPLPRRNTF